MHLHRPTTSSAAAQQFSFQCTCGLQTQRAKKQTWIRLSRHSAICEGYTLLGSQNAPPSCPLHKTASTQYSMRRAKKFSGCACSSVTQVYVAMLHILPQYQFELVVWGHICYIYTRNVRIYSQCALDSPLEEHHIQTEQGPVSVLEH